jgi:hypothetical protein
MATALPVKRVLDNPKFTKLDTNSQFSTHLFCCIREKGSTVGQGKQDPMLSRRR